MPKIKYESKNFSASSLAMIRVANQIIAEYRAQGFTLTLRQLYYQFVARAVIPNTMQSYKRLGSIVNDGRLAGLIDWTAIEDRTRALEKNSHWDSPADIVKGCAEQFRFDLWADQCYRPEVWIEKEALAGVVEGVCAELDVPYFACRGYVSQSEQWRAGMRFAAYRKKKQTPIVLHFGDHDPSGIDMTRDNESRLTLFASFGVEVERLALNMAQVEEYNPPPNPAKVTDSRFESYQRIHGDESWELDALEPAVLVRLIRDRIEELTDHDLMDSAIARQGEARAQLSRVAEQLEAEEGA